MQSDRRIPGWQPFVATPPRQLVFAAIFLIVASSIAAWSAFQPHASEYPLLRVAAAIAIGPIGGWWDACRTGRIANAFALLITMTLAALLPLAAWIRRPRHSGLLGLATFLWFTSGYYFTIGMWI
jgi:hypothetical protein